MSARADRLRALTIEDATRSRIGPTEATRMPQRVEIACAADIVTARERGRALGGSLGFSGSDLTVIATVISELARNIIEYATTGTIVLQPVERNGRPGLGIEARDEGPGIDDIARALSAGCPTGSGLGLGLSGVRRMVDEFEVASQPGQGTTVTVRKWLP
jgi:serine/threonine-protein kinase RsbT